MKGQYRQWLVIVLALVMSFTGLMPAASAQTANTGVITGVVKDESGAVVQGASVKAIHKGTNVERRTTTSGEGIYELSQLVPGEYRVEIEASGFAKYVQETVTVNVLSRVTVDPELKPAGTSEQVNVTTETAPVIESTKTDIGGVVTQRQLENLPVNGRSFASLAVLVPGATQAASFDPTKARTGTFSVGGSTGRNVNITIDGGDNKDNVVGGIMQNFSMEGIQEFALSTQRFSAANGRSGGALLSVVSKSGTNSLHGSAFGFFRHDVFNANAPKILAEANPLLFEEGDAVKPPFDRQQYGGSLGGRIIKDKLFWFGAFEHTRERATSIVPTSAFREIQFLEPLGYQPARFLPQPFNDTQFTLKGDYHPLDNHSFTFRYAQQNNDAMNDQLGFLTVYSDLTGGDLQTNDIYSALGSWTWTATPHVLNQFLYQWSSFTNKINGVSDLPNLTFADGLIAVGQNQNVPQSTLQKKHQFRDDLSWNRGRHGFKFGVDFVYEPTIAGLFAPLSAPNYNFVDTITNIATDTATYPQGFFTPGVVDTIVIGGGDPSTAFLDPAYLFSFYAQDDWKVTSRLTLNLGLRYDVDLGYVDNKQQVNNRAVRALQIIGNPYGSRLAEDDKNNFSPRFGFAYDLSGRGTSVIRGGYGIYYDQSFQNVVTFAVQQAHEEIYGTILDDSQGLSLASPAPVVPRPFTNPLPGTRGRMIDPDFESPYSQQWNIGYARELGANMGIEFDYIHILGLHEFTGLDINPRIGPLINAQRTDPTGAAPRLLAPDFAAHAAELIAEFGSAAPFGRISAARSDGRSRYDAFTVAFKRRYANRFTFNAHYTLSKAVTWYTQAGDFGNGPQNAFRPFDPAADFGPSNEDERHRFVVSGVFDLPWGLQLSPIIQLASARPYSILPDQGVPDINRDGVANDRETSDGNDQNHLSPNTERGDNFSQVNLRVSKYFGFKDRMKLGFFFETFNLFNTANFGGGGLNPSVQNVVGTPDFGRPINFYGATGFSEPIGIPFQAQFGFRFNF